MTDEREAMTRAEWIAIGAILLNVLTLVFGGGAFWQTVQDHERRIVIQENRSDALVPRIERIDANVEILIDQMREKRRSDK
jgi:hypothetical protein